MGYTRRRTVTNTDTSAATRAGAPVDIPDFPMARAAGCPVIAVSYGYGKDHSNSEARADGFVDRLTDLVTMYLRSPACQPRLKLCTTGAT